MWNETPSWAWTDPQLRVLATWNGLHEPDQSGLDEAGKQVSAGRTFIINSVKALLGQEESEVLFSGDWVTRFNHSCRLASLCCARQCSAWKIWGMPNGSRP
ncbi:hypothetical protein ColTof4_14409 [Colletotrichum tofieldiae]|nr:hypothetical protein ColTof3_14871 [Colletotrichum tofieldiae]GKT81986.1 hypothetical protein ColTof4_14409 [Colletotrichum tofieldiae]